MKTDLTPAEVSCIRAALLDRYDSLIAALGPAQSQGDKEGADMLRSQARAVQAIRIKLAAT